MTRALAVVFLACSLAARAPAREVELTVYNQGFGLVRDLRTVTLEEGLRQYRFTDVAGQIDPTSVRLEVVSGGPLTVLEQNFEYDLVNPGKLLTKHIDSRIRAVDEDGNLYEGVLAAFDGGSLVLMDGSDGPVNIISRSALRTISLPELPEGLITRPTLSWLLDVSGRGERKVRLAYITSGIGWSADYVVVLAPEDDAVDLTGWVTLNNSSGVTYPDARLKLVAGDVRREAPEVLRRRTDVLYAEAALAGAPQFEEKGFFEYHLYTLSRRTTIKDNETKQIELLDACGVPARKRYVYRGALPAQYRYDPSDPRAGTESNRKVNVLVSFRNDEESHMGMPLPGGRMRLYKRGEDGSLEFVGEDRIDHTPKDEEVELYVGDAFDIVGERTQTDFNRISASVVEESYEIQVRNHKEEAVTVDVEETFWRSVDWSIVSSNASWEKLDAQRVRWSVPVPADGKAAVTYTVRYRFR